MSEVKSLFVPEGLEGERVDAAIARLLDHARDVMAQALDQGGTSFDSLYVNVNGASGYFDRSLQVYGRAGRPCRAGRPGRPACRR